MPTARDMRAARVCSHARAQESLAAIFADAPPLRFDILHCHYTPMVIMPRHAVITPLMPLRYATFH